MPDAPFQLDLDAADAMAAWTVVLDGVMGGRSSGRVEHAAPGTLRIAGTLSLENEGGFVHARTGVAPRALDGATGLLLRVRGDGRTYRLTLRSTEMRVRAGGYQAAFVAAAAWSDIELPFDRFELRSFGRAVPQAPPLMPASIESIGFTLADARPGPFAFEVAGVRAVSGVVPPPP